MTRPGLLLTAVATVTLPGLLAVMGVLGHGHVAAEAGTTAVALDGAPLSESSPVAPATAPATAYGDVATLRSSPGMPDTPLSSVTIGQRALGMRLLGLAANASLATSYQGTELISQSGIGGSVTMSSQVWHKAGGATLVETCSGTTPVVARHAAARSAGSTVASSDPLSGSPEGVFGVTKGLVALLGRHYTAVYWGSGSVAERPTAVVELYRANGSLAARYWLDSQTLVPLRREIFGTSGHVISDDTFVQIQFDAFILPQIANKGASPSQASRAAGQTEQSP